MSYISEVMYCEACGHRFDTIIGRSERDQLHPCDDCGEVQARRTIAVIAISDSDSHTRPGLREPSFVRQLKELSALRRHSKELSESGQNQEAARINRQVTEISKQSTKE